MRILSLFDGLSAGRIALDNLGISVTSYEASEIDKYAIQVSKKNYPDIIQVGDVCDLPVPSEDYDLLIGGSPCQSFSSGGRGLGFKGKSGLFNEYLRIKNSGKFKYFFLENVIMKKEWEDIISKELGVSPVKINSRLFSAQSRGRLYWTNIPVDPLPTKDSSLKLLDIIDNSFDPKYYLRDETVVRIKSSRTGGRFIHPTNDKASTILAGYYKIPSDTEYLIDAKTNKARRFTPDEFEKLQGIPLGYTSGVSDTQRYKMVGNSWNVPTIEFLFKNLV